MKAGRIVGTVWLDENASLLTGIKLMIIRPYDLMRECEYGNSVIAKDPLDTGIGDLVLYTELPKSEETVCGRCIDAEVIGIVDGYKNKNFLENQQK